jgi:hypothetical protein
MKGRLLAMQVDIRICTVCIHPLRFWMQENNHHLHQRILNIMELLTRSGLTHSDTSSVVFPGSFCLVQIDLNARSGLLLTAIKSMSIAQTW